MKLKEYGIKAIVLLALLLAVRFWYTGQLNEAKQAGVQECQDKQAAAKLMADNLAIEEAATKQELINKVSSSSRVVTRKLDVIEAKLTLQALEDAKNTNSNDCSFSSEWVRDTRSGAEAIRGAGKAQDNATR